MEKIVKNIEKKIEKARNAGYTLGKGDIQRSLREALPRFIYEILGKLGNNSQLLSVQAEHVFNEGIPQILIEPCLPSRQVELALEILGVLKEWAENVRLPGQGELEEIFSDYDSYGWRRRNSQEELGEGLWLVCSDVDGPRDKDSYVAYYLYATPAAFSALFNLSVEDRKKKLGRESFPDTHFKYDYCQCSDCRSMYGDE